MLLKGCAYICAGLAIASFTGCASVTGTTNQSVSVQSREQNGTEVPGAACELTNNKGKWFVTTPGSVMIHKSNDDMQVLCNKAGLEPGRAAVVSETKGSMFGNILLGGGIGALVDHNNGSAYEYPNFIQIVMGTTVKIEAPKPVDKNAPSGAAGSPVQSNYAATVSSSSATTQTASADATAAAMAKPNKEERLKELKKLFDGGLISQDVYAERQRKILD